MAGWIAAAVLAVVSIFLLSSLRLSHRRRLDLSVYVAMLLFEDEVREEHRRKALDWLRSTGTGASPSDLAIRFSGAVEHMAEQVSAAGGVLGLGGMLGELAQDGS